MSASRRRFLEILGGVAAAPIVDRALPRWPGHTARLTASPQAAAQDPGRKIGWCIVGLGRISMGEFMPGVRISQRSTIVALVSGHRDKAERIAGQYGVDHKAIYSYENYDEIAHNPEIEAVYVALPNSMHAEYTVRAAQAGKHVLCEKPMANTSAECEQMIAAAQKAGRKLMIAYRCRLEPTNLRAIELVRQGYVGTVQTVTSADGFNIGRGEWRLDKGMAGGGPMMDVGIYSLQACRYLTGEEPVELNATWSVIDKDGRFSQVEENVVWTMRFPSGAVTTCQTSYGANLGNRYRVDGSKGWLESDPAFVYDGLHLRGHGNGPAIDQATDDPSPHQFAREADHFAGCVLDNRDPVTPGEEGLRDLKLMEAIYKSCREEKPVKV